MSFESVIDTLEIRNANKISFVGTSSSFVDTTTGRIQTKGIQHNSNVITDVSGPHGRVAPTLKKYPEIAFESGKFDSNESTNTYVQAGYTVSASTTNPDTTTKPWKAFNDTQFEGNGGWCTPSVYSTSNGSATSSATEFPSGRRGEYIDLKLPKAIKVDYFIIKSRQGVGTAAYIPEDAPGEGYLYGSDNGSNWEQIKEFTGLTYGNDNVPSQEMVEVGSTTFYKYLRLQGTKRSGQHSTDQFLAIGELEYYGYEENPPAGDHSVDTTFKSRFNNPQLTGVQVLVDGNAGQLGANQISGGPDSSGNHATYVTDGKYWTLNGTLTSNLSVEANTFLEGDAPHSLSMWFNSSNLEANVSNTCVFSVSDQEKLDSVNLDLQSNTWHNLTYAYQGEGGSRVAYLDGRKVLEDQAEDTFGDYPPFAMTGYSQGGYVVSSNYENSNSARQSWCAFDETSARWQVDIGYSTADPFLAIPVNGLLPSITDTNGTPHVGHWLKLELPFKIKLDRFKTTNYINSQYQLKSYVILGSNDDVNWTLVHTELDADMPNSLASGTEDATFSGVGYFKYLKMLVKSKLNGVNQTLMVQEVSYYGHRENDLVRLPDPTNVLKYPHIAMTGPAQRGYVFTASSQHSTTGAIYSRGIDNGYLFDGDPTTVWHSETNGTSNYYYDGSEGSYGSDSISNFDPTGINIRGEWVQLKFPHKLKISKVHIRARSGQENQAPEDFAFYGSQTNAAGSWTLIQSFTGQSPQDDGTSYYDITSNPPHYKYILMLTTRIIGNGQVALSMAELQYYGTEEATPVPLQIGGGNIDKVANFRVYDKFIGEDQVNEIWNAQKEEFGRAKPQMVLQQGKLGIGTDAPQGSLSVADEPDPTTYGLQEFPPKPLSDSLITHIEGHGIFKVYASVTRTGTNGAVNLFDKKPVADGGSFWLKGSDVTGGGAGYNLTSGAYEGESGTIYRLGAETSTGQYATLEMPYPIKLEKYSVGPRSAHEYQTPKDWELWGSNDGSSWTKLHNVIGNAEYVVSVTYDAPQTNYYRHFGFVVTRTIMTGRPNNYDYLAVGELKFFGYREQVTKQSVLHDGQLTLTKSLTVPRIGPALDADDTPRRDKLFVEYNTSTNPTFDGAVRDTSGRGNDGIMYNGSYYDATEKALKFDGTNDYINVRHLHNVEYGNIPYAISIWLKPTSGTTTPWRAFFAMGIADRNGTHNNGESWGNNTGDEISMYYPSNSNYYTVQNGGGAINTGTGLISAGKWDHVVSQYDGQHRYIYVNGNLEAKDTFTGMNLPPDMVLNIGRNTNTENGGEYADFSMSNFKWWLGAALTTGEVKTLYDMGRCDEGGHVVNFSKTRVGIGLGDGEAPRSALDVRDLIYARTTTIGTFTGQHICFPDESMEKGLIVSAKKNKFVKLNGLAIGKSAITIDESLPIVSLSNVAQDKACFGVVSKMEESNTAYRTEITGGLVSESIKIVGDNRAVVNSVGEGAIWVVDTNGPLESGDYITTSNVAGYGQKQDDDVLHNFTVAKITMDCDFTGSNVAVQTIKREQTGTQIITEDAWNQLVEYDRYSNVEDEITTYYQVQRGGNVLDENGQLQFEDKTGATEEPYERRFLTTDGTQTDEANAAHIAAFVGCTYHCG